jgi:hypothetical protein
VIPARLFQFGTALATTFLPLTISAPAAQQQSYPKTSPTIAYTPAVGRCLTAEQRKVNDNYNSLTRPTQPGDDMPFWDPEYLAGTWDIDMRSQDSVFGPGGQSTGTLTIKPNDKNDCLYEGTLKGEDPDGKAFTRTISASYDPIKKILTWTEKDSRGYTIVKQGPIGGELGGLFHHHFGEDAAAPATTMGGKTYRFKGVSEMSSPAYFKSDLQISENGGPFKTFGRIVFEKRLDSK